MQTERRVGAIVTMSLLASWQSASAQPAASAPAGSSPPTAAPRKSPWTATGLAVGVTLGGLAIGGLADSVDPDASSPATWVGLGVGYAALAAGPSAGHWYAGEGRHALTWTVVRGAGIAAFGGGVYLAFDAYDDDRALVPGVLLAAAGTVAFTVGLYWDLADAHRAAHRANRRAQVSVPSVAVLPLPGGAALALGSTF